MKHRYIVLLMALALSIGVAHGREIAGVQIPETATVENAPLLLNGAGIRSKFFVKVYVCAFYLKNRENSASAALTAPSPKSMRLHIVHSEISGSQLTSAISDGFAGNSSAAELDAIKTRLEQFQAMFPTVRRGDLVRLDFLSDGNTEVWINDTKRGAIPGADFQKALLKVWLGDKPLDEKLKRGLLGES